ncbi:MAG: leucine-rich repeat protein, partial [Lachnospiraceae bacterium]|nr:leucine-rich repeat protein [Lachnospiraceae bacterium]
GNYAFGNCDNLTNVSLSDNVNTMGLRPFKECEKLTYVDFPESENFVCDNGIIYGLKDGQKNWIVECLETRGSTGPYSIGASMVNRTELEGVEGIQDEAFMGCLGIGDVNLSTSRVGEIPVSCFEDTTNLFSVELPNTTKTIREDAFKNSGVRSLTIPESVSYIDSSAFTQKDGTINKNITISAVEGSAAETFAKLYGLTLGEPIVKTFSVVFFDWDDTILSQQSVEMGKDAVAPANPVRLGYTFVGWKPDFTQIARDMSIYAFYDRTMEDLGEIKHTVTFYDWKDEVISKQTVYDGEDAVTPIAPERDGYNVVGWRQPYTNVKQDIDVYAEYEKVIVDQLTYTVTFYNFDNTIVSRQNVLPGETPVTPVSPTREGYKFTGWLPEYSAIDRDLDIFAQYESKASSGSSTSTSDEGGKKGSSEAESESSSGGSGGKTQIGDTYVVSVENGSGSGSYTKGSTVNITAIDIPGKKFSNWATASTDIMISDVTSPAASFLMPEHAVVVVAKYTTTSSSTKTIAGATASGNSVPRKTINNGTRVDITKSGFSNKDVAAASVSGSSDNFVVKITEDENARMLVEQALLAEYGSLENIKYFAMDISLYDSTGQNKIVNTNGLSVTVTIPIPDALREYAGNNRIAGVLNGRLDKLNPKFTTIDGVPCVSFVATHFSPYSVYVDTSNLTVGTVQDVTPTTGDPIHPKWFLVIGLALLSILLFGARGSKKKVVISA